MLNMNVFLRYLNYFESRGILIPGKLLTTTAYYVPEATIRLFSPQVCINENPTNSSLFLDSTGIALTLTCGNILRFPPQKESNLPIMLTQKALNESTSKCAAHMATPN